jgi:hypothetical protein
MIEEVLSVKCQVLSRAGQARSLPRPLTSNSALRASAKSPAKSLVQTKPNLGNMGRLGNESPRRGLSCETEPIWAVGLGPGGRNAQNKPNWQEPIVRNKANLQIADWGRAFAGWPIARNEPNLAGRPVVRNKANFGESGWDRRAKRAKQTQFAPGQSGRAAAGANRAKQTQFQVNWAAGTGRWCETKPICSRRDTPPLYYSITPVFQPDAGHSPCGRAGGSSIDFGRPEGYTMRRWADGVFSRNGLCSWRSV